MCRLRNKGPICKTQRNNYNMELKTSKYLINYNFCKLNITQDNYRESQNISIINI